MLISQGDLLAPVPPPPSGAVNRAMYFRAQSNWGDQQTYGMQPQMPGGSVLMTNKRTTVLGTSVIEAARLPITNYILWNDWAEFPSPPTIAGGGMWEYFNKYVQMDGSGNALAGEGYTEFQFRLPTAWIGAATKLWVSVNVRALGYVENTAGTPPYFDIQVADMTPGATPFTSVDSDRISKLAAGTIPSYSVVNALQWVQGVIVPVPGADSIVRARVVCGGGASLNALGWDGSTLYYSILEVAVSRTPIPGGAITPV